MKHKTIKKRPEVFDFYAKQAKSHFKNTPVTTANAFFLFTAENAENLEIRHKQHSLLVGVCLEQRGHSGRILTLSTNFKHKKTLVTTKRISHIKTALGTEIALDGFEKQYLGVLEASAIYSSTISIRDAVSYYADFMTNLYFKHSKEYFDSVRLRIHRLNRFLDYFDESYIESLYISQLNLRSN